MFAQQFLGVAGDAAQRCLEVMGHGVGEAAQVLILGPQLRLNEATRGDVFLHCHVMGDQAGRVHHRGDGRLFPENTAVLFLVAKLAAPGVARGQGLPQFGVVVGAFVARLQKTRVAANDFGQGVAGQRLELGVDVLNVTIGIGHHDGDRALLDRAGQLAIQPTLMVALRQRAAQLQQGHDLAAQHLQGLALGRIQLARGAVNHTQRAQSVAGGRHQRHAGIKPNVGLARDQGVVGKAGVLLGVRHLQQLVGLQNGVRTKSHFSRCLSGLQPGACLEPLALLVNQRDQCDGCLTNMGRQLHQVVKRRLRACIQHRIGAQRLKALCFLRWHSRFHGGNSKVGMRIEPPFFYLFSTNDVMTSYESLTSAAAILLLQIGAQTGRSERPSLPLRIQRESL